MEKIEQDVLDALMDRNYVIIYTGPLSMKRSGRLTHGEAQELLKREGIKYHGCVPYSISYVRVAPHIMKLDVFGDTDAAALLSVRDALNGKVYGYERPKRKNKHII